MTNPDSTPPTEPPSLEDLARHWEVLKKDARFREFQVANPNDGTPIVHLEDVSAVPFVAGIPGIEEYQHRARVRAGDNELFVAVTSPTGGYEGYCRDQLGLGAPEFILAAPAGGVPWAVAKAAMQGRANERLVQRARESGGLVLHPYMAMEDVWELAENLSERSGTAVQVIGPTPAVNWIANDKAMFSEVVRATVGDGFLLETRTATSVASIAALVREFARRHERVGLKRTRCASAMGNLVLTRDRASDADALAEEFLTRTEWPAGEEVLVVEWAESELSPSTQLWIPSEGQPRCDGVYEQLLEGAEKCFLGSRPSTLPEPVNRALENVSIRVAEAFQMMGYVGRCSFDFVVIGDVNRDFSVRFTECNGRWGGTSTPMRLIDRLFEGERPHYVAQDWMSDALIGVPFTDLADRLGKHLYDPATGRGRFILYNVGPLAGRGKFDVIGLGDDPEHAWAGVRELLPTLLW
jgi:hypothetical protein